MYKVLYNKNVNMERKHCLIIVKKETETYSILVFYLYDNSFVVIRRDSTYQSFTHWACVLSSATSTHALLVSVGVGTLSPRHNLKLLLSTNLIFL